jgi:hypothetical protein
MDFPMTLAVTFPFPVKLSSISMTAHEAYTPSEVEVYLGSSPPLQPNEIDDGEERGSFGAGVFERLGFITFRGGAAGGMLERETKVISDVDEGCEFVKLVVHEPVLSSDTVKFNKGQQVGLTGLSFTGEPVDSLGLGYGTIASPENHSLLVAEIIGVDGMEGLGDMEKALLKAGVSSSIVRSVVGIGKGVAEEKKPLISGTAEERVDEETMRLVERAKELCAEAVRVEDFILAKRRKNAVDSILSLGKHISLAKAEEEAAARADDFDLAAEKNKEVTELRGKRDKIAEEGGVEADSQADKSDVRPEDGLEEEESAEKNNVKPPKPNYRKRVRGEYKFVANPVVEQKDLQQLVKGNKEFEEVRTNE